MLRRIALAAAAISLLAAPAAAETNGSISLGYSTIDFSSDLDTTSIGGSIYHGFGNGFGIQGDATYLDTESSGFENSYAQYDVHGLYRSEAWAAGLVAGHSEYFNSDIDIYGLEGAYYFDRFTISGSYLHGDADFSQEVDRLALEGRYFVTDNLSLGAYAAKINWENPVIEGDGGAYDVSAEYRLSALPLALSVGYGRTDLDIMREVDGWRVGLRWDFGVGSLIERDRHGASFDDVAAFMNDVSRID